MPGLKSTNLHTDMKCLTDVGILGVDFSLVTWFMFVGYAATIMIQANAGIGRHIWDVRASSAPRISQVCHSYALSYYLL